MIPPVRIAIKVTCLECGISYSQTTDILPFASLYWNLRSNGICGACGSEDVQVAFPWLRIKETETQWGTR